MDCLAHPVHTVPQPRHHPHDTIRPPFARTDGRKTHATAPSATRLERSSSGALQLSTLSPAPSPARGRGEQLLRYGLHVCMDGWSEYQNHPCEGLCCWCFAQRYAPLAMQNSAKVQREWYYKTGQQRRLPKKSRSSGTRVSPKTTRRCRERRKATECREVFGRVELLKNLLKTECYKWRRGRDSNPRCLYIYQPVTTLACPDRVY